MLATCLLGLGLTMLVGAKFGRARVLTVPALLLTIVLAATGTSAGSVEASLGDRSWTPANAAAVQSKYALGAGDIALDLSSVDPAGGTVSSAIRLGAGDVSVTLPPDVDANLTLHTLVGDIQLPDRTLNGNLGARETVHLAPVGGAASKGTINLDIVVDLGEIQVMQG